jgi:hypothetical protein
MAFRLVSNLELLPQMKKYSRNKVLRVVITSRDAYMLLVLALGICYPNLKNLHFQVVEETYSFIDVCLPSSRSRVIYKSQLTNLYVISR